MFTHGGPQLTLIQKTSRHSRGAPTDLLDVFSRGAPTDLDPKTLRHSREAPTDLLDV